MVIVTVQFNQPGGKDYDELLTNFKRSVHKYQPSCGFEEIKIEAPERIGHKAYFMTYNTEKLKLWVDFLRHTKKKVIFADCDMLLLRSAEHAFDITFDVAYTRRQIIYKAPNNGGIMFARPNEKAIAWYEELLEVNQRMYEDKIFHAPYLSKYVGMNQAAMGYMIENGSKSGAKVHQYLTIEWNAVEGDWQRINKDTVFCHYKGSIRESIRLRRFPSGTQKKALELWYDMAGIDVYKSRSKVPEQIKKPHPKCARRRRIR